MQGKTHVLFAKQLFQKVDGITEEAIFSLLPALDREPPHQHRLMLHSFSSLPSLICQVRFSLSASFKDRLVKYPHNNVRETKFVSHPIDTLFDDYIRTKLQSGTGEPEWDEDLNQQLTLLDLENPKCRAKAALAFGTHLFLDTWNNPVQCFMPWTKACAFQWDFFPEEKYFAYRLCLSSDIFLASFHKSLTELNLWPEPPKDVVSLLVSLLAYLRDISRPKLDTAALNAYLQKLLEQLELPVTFDDGLPSETPKEHLSFWCSMADLLSKLLEQALISTLCQLSPNVREIKSSESSNGE